MSKQPINPVTIRTPKQPNVTIGRLWTGIAGEVKKNLTVMIYDESMTAVPTSAVLDEDKFVSALGHLFPKGELTTAYQDTDDHSLGYKPGEAFVTIRGEVTREQYERIEAIVGKKLDPFRVDTDLIVLDMEGNGNVALLLAYLRSVRLRHTFESSSVWEP